MRICFLTLFLLFSMLSGSLKAQTAPLVLMDTALVIENGQTLAAAYAGGMNLPQFSPADLDGDGKDDLVVFDRAGNIVIPFRNESATGGMDYVFREDWVSGFPDDLHDLALFRDFNCDGKTDIYTWSNGGLRVFKNTSTGGNLSFVLESSQIMTDVSGSAVPLAVPQGDVPAIDDLDGDGDMDILTFDGGGTYVELHRNYSVENNGNCSGLEYVLETPCWGEFFESGLSNQLTLNSSCRVGAGNKTGVHAGSTLATFDIDGDGSKDVLIGDLLFNTLVYAHNGNTSLGAQMDTAYYNYPSYDVSVDLYVFPAAYFADINNDGRTDFVAAPNASNVSVNVQNVWYYENIGTGAASTFQRNGDNFLVSDMIDVGAVALPQFFDYNADGLMDLVIGNESRKTSQSSSVSSLTLYENTGTTTLPEFTLISTDYAAISSQFSPAIYNIAPAFGDMDNDGDVDMIIGDSDGKIHYFENTAGAGNPVTWATAQAQYKSIDVGQAATPQIADINRDGKPDLVIGEQGGTLNFFENIGSANAPDFTATPTDAAWGGIDTQILCCTGYSVPFLMESPLNSRWDLYVGAEDGTITFYEDIESSLGSSFPVTDSAFGGFRVGKRAAICGMDIDNDNEIEWAVGNLRGGISLYEPQPPVGVEGPVSSRGQIRLFPNPSNGSAHISGLKNSAQVAVFAADGKKVATFSVQGTESDIRLPEATNGLYFVQVRSGNQVEVIRWMVRK